MLSLSRSSICVLLAVHLFCAHSVAQDRRGPFTHAPRSVRSRDFDQQHLRLELVFDWDRQEMTGRAVHNLTTYKPMQSLALDAADMKIRKVQLLGDNDRSDARRLKFTTRRGQLTIELDRQYNSGEQIQLAIDYLVTKPVSGAHFVVPDESEPDQPKMVWTQSEPEYARYWFPCLDTPADRLTSEIIATVPQDYFVLSNGTLKSKMSNGDGTQTWHWEQKKSHVPYLFSIVAGEFEALEQEWEGIPIVSYVPKGRLEQAPRSFEKTPDMMAFFSEKIGYRYPWPKYSQICVDEYNWGGMEHTSATTLNVSTLHDERAHQDFTSDNLVAHELVHQWFGDLITCKDWAELWLNESFATYFATLWAEQDQGWDEATWQRHEEVNSYLKEDKRYRRPIVSYRYNRPGNMFDRHSYPKGGRVLHMLRYELGDELFWKAIHRYTTVNQFRVVETADFRIAVEDATGQSMTWFFDQWIHHGGHPEFEVTWRWDDQAKLVLLTVKQTQKVDAMTPLFRTSAEIEIAMPGKVDTRRVTVTKAEETFQLSAHQRPTRVCFDPHDWILKTLALDKSKEELLDQLAHDRHMMCRVRAAQELADFTKEKDVEMALANASRKDPFWSVRQESVKALAKFPGKNVRNTLIEIAQNDKKSDVRREAIKGLGAFAHNDTRKALRTVVKQDLSYNAIAESLRTLIKIDRDNCAADLLAAVGQASHREVILKAACDGLVKLKLTKAEPPLRDMLRQSISPQRRVVIIGALARLKPDDEETAQLLHQQLDNERREVRDAAIEALVALGDSASLEALLARRDTEQSISVIQKIDEGLEEIQSKRRDTEELRKEVESLRKQNQNLEERIKKLERAGS